MSLDVYTLIADTNTDRFRIREHTPYYKIDDFDVYQSIIDGLLINLLPKPILSGCTNIFDVSQYFNATLLSRPVPSILSARFGSSSVRIKQSMLPIVRFRRYKNLSTPLTLGTFPEKEQYQGYPADSGFKSIKNNYKEFFLYANLKDLIEQDTSYNAKILNDAWVLNLAA